MSGARAALMQLLISATSQQATEVGDAHRGWGAECSPPYLSSMKTCLLLPFPLLLYMELLGCGPGYVSRSLMIRS